MHLFDRLGLRLTAVGAPRCRMRACEPLAGACLRRASDALGEAGLLRTLRPPPASICSLERLPRAVAAPGASLANGRGRPARGCGSTGSRLLRGDRDDLRRARARFAELKDTERALYFSSGYLANLAVLTTLPEQRDVIVSDERNHASLIDGIRLSSADRA